MHEEVVGLSEGPPANAALVHIGNTNRGAAFAVVRCGGACCPTPKNVGVERTRHRKHLCFLISFAAFIFFFKEMGDRMPNHLKEGTDFVMMYVLFF